MARTRQNTYAWLKLRKQTLKQARHNNTRCGICGQPINYKTSNPTDRDAPSVDHVLPWSQYPALRLDPGNLRVTHQACNQAKGAKTEALPNFGNQSRDWSAPR